MIRVISSVILAIWLTACSGGPVEVTIDNPDHYKEYVRLLKKNKINFVVVDDKTLRVDASSFDELDEKMKEFEEYVKKDMNK